MKEEGQGHSAQASIARGPAPAIAYEPPRVERLGNLRELLAAKTKLKLGLLHDPLPLENRL